MANKVEFSSLTAEESYIQNFQSYLKQKNTYQSLLMDISTPSTQTKNNTNEYAGPEECKVCLIIRKPGDLSNILNQGLYYKYTSSQDFFYARDITALLERKRQPFCIKFQDDVIFDESVEHLKCYFPKKERKTLMEDIKQFYSQFYCFPKVFEKPFQRIMNNNVARHRRLEYIRVFQSNNPSETETQGDPLATEYRFSFMHMLGETFLKDNNKTSSISVADKIIENRIENGRETEIYLEEVKDNFDGLKNAGDHKKKQDEILKPLAPDDQKQVLYSHNDSETAEEMLKSMLQEFRLYEEIAKVPLKKSVSDHERRRKCSNDEEYKFWKDQTEDQITAKKKVPLQNRPKSNDKKQGLKKLYIDQTTILRDYLREVEEGKGQFDTIIEKSISKGGKTSREHSIEGREIRNARPESSKSPGQNTQRTRHGNTQRNLKGTNLLIKFTPDDLRDSVYDRDSLLSKVNQMRSTQNKIMKFNADDFKYNSPTSTHYQSLVAGDEGPASASLKQVKICLSPTLKNPSSIKLSSSKKYEEAILKNSGVRQDAGASTSRVRDSRPTIRRNDLIINFESNRSSKSKESHVGLESPGLPKSVKIVKSNPKFFTKIIEKSVPLSVRESKVHHETINLRNVMGQQYPETSRSAKRPSAEKERSLERGVSYDKRPSSGITKARLEGPMDKKKELARRKVNRSSSGNQQSISDFYQKVNQSKNKNEGWLKLAEVYMQPTTPHRSKSKSNGNTLANTANTSRIDPPSKLKKKNSMEFEVSESRMKERKKSPLMEDKEVTEYWSPKTARQMSNRDKSPKKSPSPSVKGFKPVRQASRGL